MIHLAATLALAVALPQADTGAVRITLPTSVEADRQRIGELTGDTTTSPLLRSASRTIRRALGSTSGDGLSLRVIVPEYHAVNNSALPYSLNEGALWAGRGLSQRLSGGVILRRGPVTLVLAPQLISEQNTDFQTITFPEPDGATRHPLASAFHFPPGSMDLPQRFGTRSRQYLDLGQSSLSVEARGVVAGLSTENQWWGPGVRNALVLSDNAPGIPHAFVRPAAPLSTRWGTFDGQWMLGRLEESDYFRLAPLSDTDRLRSYSAIAATWQPAFEPTLTLGVTRAVYANWKGGTGTYLPLGAAANAVLPVGRPWREPGDTLLTEGNGRDQLFSVFGRWVFPVAGFEAWGEWGRHEGFGTLSELFNELHHSRGYTVGLQVARPVVAAWLVRTRASHWRVQAELTNLEPSVSYRVRPFTEWYASRAVSQGYTHRGRTIGAAIGPSGSSQWLAADLVGQRWMWGVYGSRIRWENQARYTFAPEFRRSDVSLIVGTRGAVTTRFGQIALDYARTERANYLFQAYELDEDNERGVDLFNHTVRLTITLQ